MPSTFESASHFLPQVGGAAIVKINFCQEPLLPKAVADWIFLHLG